MRSITPPQVGGEVEAADHRRRVAAAGVIDHGDASVALFDRPDRGRTKAQQGAEDGLVDGIVGHHQRRFIRVEACHDLLPAGQGAVPDLLNGFAVGHHHGFRGHLPGLEQLRPSLSDFGFQPAFPLAVGDLHQPCAAGEGNTGMGGQDQLGGLAWPGHRTGVGPLDGHRSQAVPGCGCLIPTIGIERDVDLSLEPPLAIPVGFTVAHQQETGPRPLRRHGYTQMGGAVVGFDLDRDAAVRSAAEIEHGDGGVFKPQTPEP